MTTLTDRIEQLCDEAERAEVSDAELVADVRRRLREPLRVAIAGRVKAGKSTLLNALVGERLAATDAGECTRIVTWYRGGSSYEVRAVLQDATPMDLRFRRDDGTLQIDLGGLSHADIHHIEVRWPSSRLERLTLLDTPGLEAMDELSAARTAKLLGLDEDGPSQVDAVIYLMRHVHQRDARFLESFSDRSVTRPSPVNAVGALSRADEIGAARIDAMESASKIAARYAEDERIRALCTTVIPVAGLLAEAGSTLREDEFADLKTLAALGRDELESMMMSVDRFCDPAYSPLDPDRRRGLLVRLGMYGTRLAIRELRKDVRTASQLSEVLVHASGIERLVDVLEGHFGARAQLLKARSALSNLKELARTTGPDRSVSSGSLAASVEAVEAQAHELAELRLLHLVLSKAIDLSDAERSEIEQLTGSNSVPGKLGLDERVDRDAMRSVVLQRVERWRERGAHPLTSRPLQEACEIVARSYEGLYVSLQVQPT